MAEKGGYRVGIWGISFADKKTGFAVGNDGQIWKTSDGGTAWKILSRDDDYTCYFLNSKTGWNTKNDFKTRKGSLINTGDGGEIWSVQKKFESQVESHFFFINQTTGWAVGQQKRWVRSGTELFNYFILQTDDGGRTWNSQFEDKVGGKSIFSGRNNYRSGFYDVFFTNSEIGWAVGSGGNILRTEDGGKHWDREQSETNFILTRVQFIDSKEGWAIGNDIGAMDGRAKVVILHTSDSGVHWETQWEKKHYWWLYDLFFVSNNTGWAMGATDEYGANAILVITNDGGKTWNEMNFNGIGYSELKNSTHYSTLFFVDDNRGAIITTKGYIFLTTDGGKTWNKKRLPVRRYPWHVSEFLSGK